MQSHAPPVTWSGSSSSSPAARPPSAVGSGEHAPVFQSHAKPGLHGLGAQRSTHFACAGAPFTLTRRQTRIGGQTTPSQSGTHAPPAQCVPAGQRMPTHAGGTHAGVSAPRSHVSPGGHARPGSHAQDGRHLPFWQTAPSGHVTSAHGSTQPKPRQICPAGQRTPGLQRGTHRFSSSQTRPAGQPKSVQSFGAQTHVPESRSFANEEPVAQPKSSSGMHCGTHALSQHPLPRGQRSGALPEQFWSRTESHVSGAPGKTVGSASSQSHGVPDQGHPHAAKPSPSESGQTTPASHASSARAGEAASNEARARARVDHRRMARFWSRAAGDTRRSEAQDLRAASAVRARSRVLESPRAMRPSARSAAGLLAAFVVACSSSDASTTTSPGTPFTVWVLDAPLVLGGEETPIAGAKVAFDPAGGGERVTRTTEPDGHVTFEADFTRGGGAVTVLSEDHVYLTRLEASPETARSRPNRSGKPAPDLVLLPPRVDRVTTGLTVELRGTIVGKADPTHVVSLATSGLARLGSAQALEEAYALRAPKGRGFFLLGHETKTLVDREGVVVENGLVKSFRLDLPAREDDQLLDLDVAKLPALPAKVARVRVEGPTAGPFGPGTRAFASVGSADSDLVVGLFAASSDAGGGAFDVDVSVVDTDVGAERLLTQAQVVAPDGSQSVRVEPGALGPGPLRDFVLPPTIPDPDAPRTIKDPIPLEGFPAGADLEARLFAGGSLFWIVEGPPGGPTAKSFTVPYRDEVTQVDAQVFALSLSARAGRVELPTRGVVYRATGTFRDVQLRKR